MKDPASNDLIKRLKYNNGQLLDEYDFQDEQNYHREMRKRHNRSVHSWGIVEGLDVSISGKKITISAGMAIDKYGQEFVVLKEEHPEPPPDLKGVPRYLTAKFEAKDDDTVIQRDEDGKKDYSCRTVERPKVEITDKEPAKDGAVIVLTKLNWDEEGKITVDSSARSRSVSSRIDPAADLTVRRLFVEGKVGIGTTDPGNHKLKVDKGSTYLDGELMVKETTNLQDKLDVSKATTLQDTLTVNKATTLQDTLTVAKAATVGHLSLDSNQMRHALFLAGLYDFNHALYNNCHNIDKEGAWDGATWNTSGGLKIRVGVGSDRKSALYINDGCKVGIGGTNPKSTLSVKGALAVGANYAETYAAPDNGLLVEGNVGIGTTSSSSYRLNVNGNTKLDGTLSLNGGLSLGDKFSVTNQNGSIFQVHNLEPNSGGERLVGTWNGSGAGPQVRFTGAGKGFIDIGQNGAGDFVVEGSDVPRLVVQNSGNVGIGTPTPGAKLEVSGDLKVSGEILGKLRTSEEYVWNRDMKSYVQCPGADANEKYIKMWKATTSVAFLTHIQGCFYGDGEAVGVVKGSDGYWYLGGKAVQSLTIRARCIGSPE